MFRKIADQFSRFFIGILFIFSGLIKLNDPVGTKIKMEEYFEVFAEDFGSFFHYLIPYALEIGMILVVLEIVLGVAVLIYYRMKVTTVVLLALMIFFTFLTFYSAYFNKVTDCGCFGDAIKLTPWESFTKDVVLMVFVLHLFWYRKHYQPALRTLEGHAVVGAVTLISFFLGVYAIRHLPFIDFRAYKIGNNIPQQMQPAEQPVFEYVFIRKDNGEEVHSEKYLMDTTLYKYQSVRQTNEDKTKAKITDFAVTSVEGEDVTQQAFEGNKLFIIIYDVSAASASNIDKIRDLAKALEGKVDVMALTASGGEAFEAFRHEHQLAFPYYYADATVLKTIVRSNPGITLWVNGNVKGMWHHNDTPTADEVLQLIN
ncbi:DoxX family protein [Fulvivirgaceae bacterium PWU4]|uniref:DoxX family protein n=1 Tax=Chryseosolibacter histidini TaxID=2782349 RepID=A0AAP2DSA5_9BACT|nr:BT_3928 family protein [Chryseosolibacter histidini]MBT1700564.1 DoxX family protein [Chryseosolibacter histidini]